MINKKQKSFYEMDEFERFKYIYKYQKSDLGVEEYLKNILKNLEIEITVMKANNIFKLMKEEKLEGWCW